MNSDSLLSEALELIITHLKRLQRPVVDALQNGLSIEEIASRARPFPFQLPEELKQIYMWRNGTFAPTGSLLTDLQFFPGFMLLSLDEAVQMWSERRAFYPWRKGWFPVFADGAGDFYFLKCERTACERLPVFGFIHGEVEHDMEYENLQAMMLTIAESYSKAAFFVDDGMLEMNDDLHRSIAAQFNPEIPEWQS